MKFTFFWMKFYFDKGLNLTNYAKYGIALYGLHATAKATWYVALAYCIFCLLLGMIWTYFKFNEKEYEVANSVNPFTTHVMNHLGRVETK